MKNILIILSLILSSFTNINTVKNKKIFDNIDIDKYQNIMIVAHPDDETIWGGMHLLEDDYLVICLTNGNNKTRAKEFKEALAISDDYGVILDYPDKTNNKRDNWKKCYQDISNDLNYVLNNHHFNIVVTHNPEGEYGHAHHKMTSKIVSNIVSDNLYYFGTYYKKNKLPKIDAYNDKLFDKKMEMISQYSSQNKVCKNLSHMLPYEKWQSKRSLD